MVVIYYLKIMSENIFYELRYVEENLQERIEELN